MISPKVIRLLEVAARPPMSPGKPARKFSMRKAGVGQVQFKSSKFNDPHIRQLVNYASQVTGISTVFFDRDLQSAMNKIQEMKKYSPLLFDTAAKSAVDSAAFNLVLHMPNVETWDLKTFKELCNLIEWEHHRGLFPIKGPTAKSLPRHFIKPVVVPTTSPELKKYNGIKTAAATEEGTFIFNKQFMQQLINWAHLVKFKSDDPKYQSNGGPIPDSYAYIEFLIMHELMHYNYGDMTRFKKLRQFSHKIHNMASDFRINFMLTKSGYPQLPIGLFSDGINYDRQGTYEDMVQLVHDEMKKLPPPLKLYYEKLAGKMDDHNAANPDDEAPIILPWIPEPGTIVRNGKTGEYARVISIDEKTGKLTVTAPLTQAELDAENIVVPGQPMKPKTPVPPTPPVGTPPASQGQP